MQTSVGYRTSLSTQRALATARRPTNSRHTVRLYAMKPIEQLADQIDDPIVRLAVKDPVSFLGGVFAGALKLSLNEDPLKSWIERTSAGVNTAAGATSTGPPSSSDQSQ